MKLKLFTAVLLFSLLLGCGSNTVNEIRTNDVPASELGIDLSHYSEEDYKTIPGTSLSFVPQANFEPASGFVGYESLQHRASIMVMELPVPDGKQAIAYFDGLLTAQELKNKGLELVSKEKLGGNPQALLLKCKLVKGIELYIQWIYVLESDEDKIAQIQVSAPKNQFNLIEDEIREMLFSFKWTDEAAEFDTYYTIELPDGWELAKQHAVMEIYSEGGRFPDPDHETETMLLVANLHQQVSTEDRTAFLEKMNLQQKHYSDLVLLSSEDIEIDGFQANLSYVSGIDIQTFQPVIKQSCYIFLEDTTILIETDRTETMTQAEFERVIMSWKLK